MKRIAAIFLTALLLFSVTACDFFSDDQKECDSELSENSNESSENIESDKGTDDPDDLNSIESVNYSFISQEEKNTWRSDLISVLSKPRVHEIEPYLPGSISVGLMDINFDNSPEVFVAYSGGSMNNIYIEIYDLKNDSNPIIYDGACYGGYYNICLYVAYKDGEFVILSEGSLRIPETGWVTYICTEQIDYTSQALTGNILFEISSESNQYACNGQVVDKAEYEAMYQQFLLDYKKIESTQIQMMRWSDIGEVEKREPQTKSSTPVYTREEIAEIMADSLLSSSQQFIKYEAKDDEIASQIPPEYDDVINAFTEIANYQRYGNTALIDQKNYPNVSDICYNAIVDSIYKSASSVYGYFCGYAIKDINHDGTPELFLTDIEYNLYSIMTIYQSEVVVVPYSSYGLSSLSIDADGNIYISGWSKGETWYKKVFQLQRNGELYGFSYGHYDMTGFDECEIYNFYEVYGLGHSYSDSPYSYVENSTLWFCKISDEELENLVSTVEDIMKFQDPDGCGKPNHVTSTAGLEFYQVITEDRRK